METKVYIVVSRPSNISSWGIEKVFALRYLAENYVMKLKAKNPDNYKSDGNGVTPFLAEIQEYVLMDNWDRKTDFHCDSCMFYVPKREHSSEAAIAIPISDLEFRIAKEGEKGIKISPDEGRCRRRAPTMQGFTVVYSNGWCGEHKIGSNPVRDGKEPLDIHEFMVNVGKKL